MKSMPCSQNPKAFPPVLGRERGVALVVVLSFMALLVGVVLAFFSISQLQRQVSKSSSSQTSAEILADGAVNRIIGDLKSEIVAGSKTLSPSAGTAILYLPSKAANAIPALAVPGYTSATIVGSGLENVVKVSNPACPSIPVEPPGRSPPLPRMPPATGTRFR